MGNWGQGVAIQSTKPFYGVRTEITLPGVCRLEGPPGSNYLSIYIGFMAGQDPRAEVGFMLYSGKIWWTSILNGGRASKASPLVWQQQDRLMLIPGLFRKQTIQIAMTDAGHFEYFDGFQRMSSPLALPISRETYNQGGLLVRACIGWCHGIAGWAEFDEMSVDAMSVLDGHGNWSSLTEYSFKILQRAVLGSTYTNGLPLRASYHPPNPDPPHIG